MAGEADATGEDSEGMHRPGASCAIGVPGHVGNTGHGELDSIDPENVSPGPLRPSLDARCNRIDHVPRMAGVCNGLASRIEHGARILVDSACTVAHGPPCCPRDALASNLQVIRFDARNGIGGDGGLPHRATLRCPVAALRRCGVAALHRYLFPCRVFDACASASLRTIDSVAADLDPCNPQTCTNLLPAALRCGVNGSTQGRRAAVVQSRPCDVMETRARAWSAKGTSTHVGERLTFGAQRFVSVGPPQRFVSMSVTQARASRARARSRHAALLPGCLAAWFQGDPVCEGCVRPGCQAAGR